MGGCEPDRCDERLEEHSIEMVSDGEGSQLFRVTRAISGDNERPVAFWGRSWVGSGVGGFGRLGGLPGRDISGLGFRV